MVAHMTPKPDDLLGTAETARLLKRSHRTVHRLVKSGQLTPYMTAPGGFAGSYLFLRSDVEALARTLEPMPDTGS
jgi:excisionase family DNA binding protein